MIHFSEIENFSAKFGVPKETIEKDYCVTWLLIALSRLKESKDIIFYGGTAIKKIYFPDYRFSEDLDFIRPQDLKTEDILDLMERLYGFIKDKVNITFSTDKETVEKQKTRLQFFVVYDGFSELSLNKRVKIDFAADSGFFQKPVLKKLYCGYGDMRGLAPKLFVYTLEAIVTDKIGTILSTTRTEPRDLYDLWFLLKNCSLDFSAIKSNFKSKFGYDVDWTVIAPNLYNLMYKERWSRRLSRQITNPPDVDNVLKKTEQSLKKYLPRK